MSSLVNDSSTESKTCEEVSGKQLANEPGHDESARATVTTDSSGSQCYIQSNMFCTDSQTIDQTTGCGDQIELQDENNEEVHKNGCMISSFEGTGQTRSGSDKKLDAGESNAKDDSNANSELLYSIDEVPPWYLTVLLGFQQCLLMFTSTMVVPFILSGALCLSDKPVILSYILNTILFASGMVTFLQATFGSRLPIIQGTSFAFIAPTLSTLALKGPCPSSIGFSTVVPTVNSSLNFTTTAVPHTQHDEEWNSRILEIQGAIIIVSIIEITIGFTGFMGFLLKFIGPLTIVPTIVLVALPLFQTAYQYSSAHWGIAMFTLISVTIFSQLLREVKTPFPYYKNGQWYLCWIQSFKLFSVIMAVVLSWILCAILTKSGVFSPGHKARTDVRISILQEVPWFRVPYPGQWGAPTIELSTIIGMISAVLASVIESVGDYFACATISGAPPPPKHAINRGLGLEGIGCFLTGIWGTGCGTTSYSNSIAALGITRVGSRRVIQFAALFMSLIGLMGKFGALFITIPDPVIGGIFIALFGLLIGVGLSPLQFVDMNSIRNLFVIGNAMFFGMVLPFWIKWTPKAIQTGSVQLDQVITVLLSTPMAIGGTTGFILDNLLPGTVEERGIKEWGKETTSAVHQQTHTASIHTYDIPLITPYLQKFKFTKYLPFLPYYGEEYPRYESDDLIKGKV